MTTPGDAARARWAERRPHHDLRAFVGNYHGFRYDVAEPNVHHGLPGTSLTVVLALDRPIDVGWLGDPTSRSRRSGTVGGLTVAPAAIYQDGPQHGISVDVTPLGARALFGVPAAALAGELVGLDELLGARAARLQEELASVPSWGDRFALLERALRELAGAPAIGPTTSDRTLAAAWSMVHQTGGRIPVAALAERIGWSRRQLTKRFSGEFGLGPKQVARLVRFNVARGLVTARSRSLADVAAQCGYADQAHLTREWRELAGVAPSTWISQELPFLQDLAAAS